MSTLETWLIIILIIGIIASNLVVLKYSAKYKLTQFGKTQKKSEKKSEKEQDTPNMSETSVDDATQHKKKHSPKGK